MIHNLVSARVTSRVAPPAPPTKPSPDPAASFASVLKQQEAASPSVTAPSTTLPSTTVPSTVMPAVIPSVIASPAESLHSVAALPNGGLMTNPSGMNALTGGLIPYNPNYYATEQAATQLAAQLGGSVVDLRGHISNNQSEYFINLPNGTTINAGNLLSILNNQFFQENSRVMDGKIAEFLNNNAFGSPNPGTGLYTVKDGQVSYEPSFNT